MTGEKFQHHNDLRLRFKVERFRGSGLEGSEVQGLKVED
jgi:hypothetical protein